MIEQVEMIIRQPGHPDRVVKLQDGVTRLGRAEDNDIVLSDVGVSRRHARLVVTRDQVRVEDLGSGNGTYYRGFRVQSQVVEDSDELVIDPFVLVFRVKGAAKKQAGDMTMPAQGATARLDVVAGAGLAKTSYPIGPRGLTIGRSETRDVVIPDPAASRHHCSILLRDNQWVLRDMGSANGVFVNGTRVRESLLADGDRVRIGNTEMRFVIGDATQADSTTQRVSPDPWSDNDSQWTEHDVSLPIPEANTPAQRQPRRGSSAGRWIVGGIGLVALAGVLFVSAALVVVAVVVVVNQNQFAGGTATVAGPPAQPPEWKLDLPGGLPAADVRTLQEQGMESLRAGDNKTALQNFYRVLQTEPGKPSAERLAFAAGEYLVLQSLDEQLKATTEARKTREARRAQLLLDLNRSSTKKRAMASLVAEYRDDPVVNDKLDWTPSQAMEAIEKDLAAAAEHVDGERWAEAAALYAKIIEKTQDPTWRKTASAGLKSARRELARLTASEWREGVLAESKGDAASAKAHYEKVLAADPGNVSAKTRLARLK